MFFSNTVYLSLAILGTSSAVPTTSSNLSRDVPEVIPGPGLPSLASLGLTSADLYAMGAPKLTSRSGLHKRGSVPECGPENDAYTDVNDIIACYNYLNSLGTRNCAVPSNPSGSQFCVAGSGQAIGISLTGNPESSYCRDVASAVLWVINDCTRPDQSVAGFQAAGGNGNLAVGGVNINY